MMVMKSIWLAALAAGVCSAVQAQAIYRCGPDGREYSQQPCAGASVLDASDNRDQGQRREAQSVAKRDAELAATLARERRTQEAAAMRERAAGFHPRSGMRLEAAEQAAPHGKSFKVSTRKKRKG